MNNHPNNPSVVDIGQASIDRIVAMVQSMVDRQIAAFQQQAHNRFLNVERRLTAVEDAIVTNFGTGALPGHSRNPSAAGAGYRTAPLPAGRYGPQEQPSNQAQLQVAGPAILGSSQNAGYVPYAIEMIAKKYRQKPGGDDHKWQDGNHDCDRPTFHIDCFREEHFRWCIKHQRPVLPPHANCGRDYKGCEWVRFERHPNWEMIVNMSFASSKLGNQGVDDLPELLFPYKWYPHKYDQLGSWRG